MNFKGHNSKLKQMTDYLKNIQVQTRIIESILSKFIYKTINKFKKNILRLIPKEVIGCQNYNF